MIRQLRMRGRSKRRDSARNRIAARPTVEAIEQRLLLSLTTIDVPGASSTFASGINDAGQVVGSYFEYGSGYPHGFLESGGSFTTIDVPGAFYTMPGGINDAGQVVGGYADVGGYPDTSGPSHGFLESGGSFTTIDVPGASDTSAYGINDGGQVVGEYGNASGGHGFLESGGSFTTIDVPGASYTSAYGINDGGQVVGYYVDASRHSHGFLESGGSFTTIDVPGASATFALGINDAGQVVGYYDNASGYYHGFLESGGSFTTIDVPGASSTFASGINDAGQVVGQYDNASGYHGFLLVLQNIEVTSLAWNSAQGGVDYGYTISNADLPQATTVDLYWASGTTTDTEIGRPITSTTTETAQGTYSLHATPAQLGTPPTGAKDLLVVADPNNTVSPADPSKIASLALPDIAATSLTWDTTQGGVDYGYTISNANLPQATTVDLYWSSGTTTDTEIGSPITSTTTETAQGTYSIHATPAQLGTPPPGAEDLLVVVDPNNTISPADPSKIANLVLPNISVTSLIWHPDDETTWTSDPVDSGGVDFDYTITGSALPKAVPIDLYWASGTTLANKLGSPISENDDGTPIMTETTQGSYQVHISAIRLGTPPPGSTDLLVVADPPDDKDPAGLIIESNQEDNLQALGASASDILANSIHVSIVGSPQITAMFMPAEGSSPPAENQPAQGALSLVQAEAILGINHFNWIQHYVMPSYEHEYLYYGTLLQRELVSPIIDPDDVSGNQSNLTLYSVIAGRDATFHELSTDSWPYYWDEPSELQDKGQLPSGSSNPSALFFEDTPMQPDDFLKPSDSWSFTTELAGVTAGPTYSEIPLALTPFFSWYSNAVYDHIKFPYPYSGGGVFMKSTDSTILPPLLSGGVFDVQVGLEQATSLSTVSGTGPYGGTAALTATLTSGGSPVAGETVTFTLTAQGTPTTVGTATTDPNGIATLTGVSLTGFAAGTYSGAITATFAADASDLGSSTSGDLTVTPAPLSVVAANQTMVYGSVLPTLSGTLAGVVNGDNITASFGTTATSSSDAGTYPIVATLNDPNGRLSNYTVTNTPGTLTITQATPMVTLTASVPVVATGQPVTFTATVSGPASAAAQPTGSVQFELNGQNYGSPVTLSPNGTADQTFSWTTAANESVTAVYLGDRNYQTGPSPTVTEPVLAPGAYAMGTTLVVLGANTTDAIAIVPLGRRLDGSTGLGVVGTLNGRLAAAWFVQAFTTIEVFGYGGNDGIGLAPTLTLATTIVEGGGNDTIVAGAGNTAIALGKGNDFVLMGNGNDTVTAGDGNVTIVGGNGSDSVTLGNGADSITLGNGNDTVSAGDGADTVTLGNGNDTTSLGNGSDVIVEGKGNDNVSAGNGPDLVVGGLGQHAIQLGNGNDILIDGSATVVKPGDSLRQILSDWNSSSSASVNTRLKVVYNTSHPNVLKAGSGRDWFFFKNSNDVTNQKSTDRVN